MEKWNQALERLPTNSLLVSTVNHTIIRFYCPIAATCHTPIAGYKAGERVFIDGIAHDEQEALLYLIDGLRLPHHFFHINS